MFNVGVTWTVCNLIPNVIAPDTPAAAVALKGVEIEFWETIATVLGAHVWVLITPVRAVLDPITHIPESDTPLTPASPWAFYFPVLFSAILKISSVSSQAPV